MALFFCQLTAWLGAHVVIVSRSIQPTTQTACQPPDDQTMRIPGLIDIHTHLRDPGQTHKEDFSTGTAAALAGGITTVLAMPNTSPPLVDAESFNRSLDAAQRKARCDFGIYLGANNHNAAEISPLAAKAVGLKMYLDATFGPLLLDDLNAWVEHFERWPASCPIVAHAEGANIPALLFVACLFDRPVHICHVSRRDEIELIRAAKEKGHPVTCEVTPHHLFLTHNPLTPNLLTSNLPTPNLLTSTFLPPHLASVRPPLATPDDQQALWDNLAYIDCFATDHAPHLRSEKESESSPPGFPGLETALPLLLTAVHADRLTLDDIVARMHTNPRRIFGLPEQPETWVEIDPEGEYILQGRHSLSKSGWTPFEGWHVKGRVTRVVLRGQVAYENGKVLAEPGYGTLVTGKLVDG